MTAREEERDAFQDAWHDLEEFYIRIQRCQYSVHPAPAVFPPRAPNRTIAPSSGVILRREPDATDVMRRCCRDLIHTANKWRWRVESMERGLKKQLEEERE